MLNNGLTGTGENYDAIDYADQYVITLGYGGKCKLTDELEVDHNDRA